ncbi:hypothetical protein EV714DRAFT_268492 [Schizophyllum commune]
MPAKYAHVKKRAASGLPRKPAAAKGDARKKSKALAPSPQRNPSLPLSPTTKLERAIARMLLLRYEHDIARLFSTRLFSVSLIHLPTFIMRCIALGGPGWIAHNADTEDVKDFLRAVIGMDMRQAGERVATKSVLWSYTALRHFALSNNVHICQKRGLHSQHLIPHYDALKSHIDSLESAPPPIFEKPAHLGSLADGERALEEACEIKFGWRDEYRPSAAPDWDREWRTKVRTGYARLTQVLWRVAREFDVRGYGSVLREKLIDKWCDCGCSTDHLGEVCEKTVRDDERINGRSRNGKQREWDGRGSGVLGWETEDEEDVWEVELDFGPNVPPPPEGPDDPNMSVSEMLEVRYYDAEREKEKVSPPQLALDVAVIFSLFMQGNAAFRRGDYAQAVKHYEAAYHTEPELPHYQLNLAAAHLKLSNWMEAEKACTLSLGQHRSGKGYFRRARARRMLNRTDEAIRDLRAALKLQPSNIEALTELCSLIPDRSLEPTPCSSSAHTPSSSAHPSDAALRSHLGLPKPKPIKPPPFPRTEADERVLKFSFLPAPSDEAGIGALRRELGLRDRQWARSGYSRKGSKKAGGKEGEGVVREEDKTILFPSWEWFSVKRVDCW